MKKGIRILGGIILAALVGLSMSACDTGSPARDPGLATPTEGLVFSRDSGAEGYTVTGLVGTERGIVIPATRNGLPVIAIGDSAFAGRELVSVTIPDSVATIGSSAFAGNQLDSITIPASVTSISGSAFADNPLASVTIGMADIPNNLFSGKGLTSVTLLDSVTSIGELAFADNLLTSIAIPHSVTSIGGSAFADNPLTSVSIGMADIPNNLFSGKGLTSVTLLDGVTSIGESAFAGNQLDSITIPASVTSIGGSAFADNPLASVTIGMVDIPDNLFSDKELTSVTLLGGVTSIGESAFASNQLDSITIPTSVTSIGGSAFSGNYLTSVIIGSGVDIGNDDSLGVHGASFLIFYNGSGTGRLAGMYAFAGGSWTLGSLGLTFAPTTGGYAVTGYMGTARDLIIPNAHNGLPVVSISANAFAAGNQLTSVVIPDSVTSIGANAFANNPQLNVTVGMVNIPNALFSGQGLTSVTLLDSVASIGNSAFSDNRLTRITIPASIASIGSLAFANNLQLASLTVGMATIGDNLFNPAATNNARVITRVLTSVTLLDIVTAIGQSAFANNGLASITIPASVASIGNSAFANNTSLTNLTIGMPVIGDNLFSRAWYNRDRAIITAQLRSVTLLGSVTTVGSGAFTKHSFNTITIGSGVDISTGWWTMGTSGSNFRAFYYLHGRQAGSYFLSGHLNFPVWYLVGVRALSFGPVTGGYAVTGFTGTGGELWLYLPPITAFRLFPSPVKHFGAAN